MDALLPKTRCDKGAGRVITPEAEQEIHRLKREYPRLNGTQIHARLVQEAFLPADVSVAVYGIHNKLYVDNGAPYSNDQLSYICGSIGTVLLHTPVRDGASKGKVERNFRTLKERWLYGLDISQIRSLKEFNGLLADHIRKHNTTVHSVTGKSPLERYLCGNEKIRKPKSVEWLEECFHNRIYRRVNRDATIHLMNTVYDAPMQFIGLNVEVRFLPGQADVH